MTAERFRPSVTVAAVITDPARPDHVLLVEERTPEGLRLNNPAGHLEQGESLQQAVVREVLEETACDFTPEAVVGVYLSRFERLHTGEDITYLRVAFAGRVGPAHSGRALDTGIVRTVWMHVDEIAARRAEHRSPLVWRCIQDLQAGRRWPLELLVADGSLLQPWRP